MFSLYFLFTRLSGGFWFVTWTSCLSSASLSVWLKPDQSCLTPPSGGTAPSDSSSQWGASTASLININPQQVQSEKTRGESLRDLRPLQESTGVILLSCFCETRRLSVKLSCDCKPVYCDVSVKKHKDTWSWSIWSIWSIWHDGTENSLSLQTNFTSWWNYLMQNKLSSSFLTDHQNSSGFSVLGFWVTSSSAHNSYC